MVQSLVGEAAIWQYEPFLARQRGKASVWWEYSIFVAVLVALVGAVALRWPLSKLDIWGAAVNLALLVLQAIRTSDVVRTRRRWEAAEPSLVTTK